MNGVVEIAEACIAGMDVIGARFKASEIYVPEVLVSVRGRHSGMSLLAKARDCKAKIIVGGAPLTQSYADEIGVQGYAPDATTAVEVANSLI